VSGQGNLVAWEANPQLWDTLNVDGKAWPGIWDVKTSGVELDLDRKKAKGKHGTKKRNQGRVSATAKLTAEVSAKEWVALEPLIKSVLPVNLDGIVTPHQFEHPLLALANLGQALVSHWKAYLGKGGKAFMQIEMRLEQFVPELPDVKNRQTTGGAPTDGGSGPTDEELTPEYLDALTNYGRNKAYSNPYYQRGQPQQPTGFDMVDSLAAPERGTNDWVWLEEPPP
jgi:hypothetical protein